MSLADPYIAILAVAYNVTLTVVATTVRLLWWPMRQLLYAILVILSPFYHLANFLLLPFVRLGQTIVSILSFPFSVKWLERIETLYIFLGTAGLIGCITGTIVFFIFRFLSSTLKIDSSIVPQASQSGRTPAEYRAAKRAKKKPTDDHSQAPTPVVLKKVPQSHRHGLLSRLVIEEDDSDLGL